jgi:hypothetical protein
MRKNKAGLLLMLGGFIAAGHMSCNNHKTITTYTPIEKYDKASGQIIISDSVQFSRVPSGYTLYMPPGPDVKGVVVFFQGSGPDTSQHLEEMKILEPATTKGVAVAFIATGNPFDFLFAEKDMIHLDSIVSALLSENKLQDKPLLFAGLSLSGTRAMKYSIWCRKGFSGLHIQPAALVVCDAPLDMIRMHDENQKASFRNFHPLASGTAQMVLPYLEQNLGDPVKDKLNYIAYSPYSYADSLGGRGLSYLIDIPVRAYHEPDINWWIQNRRKDYYSMNSMDMAGMINQLLLLGSKSAELISSDHKSLDPDESPHSWSIIDNSELINWFLKIANTASGNNNTGK